MITFHSSTEVGRSAQASFDVIGTHVFDNQPRGESEVLSVTPLQVGPARLGARALMRRRDGRRVRDVMSEVVEFQSPHRISFIHPESSMRFHLTFQVTELAADRSRIDTYVELGLPGPARLLEPLMRRNGRRRTERLTQAMGRTVVDCTPAASRRIPE
jgi:hypothetical protein